MEDINSVSDAENNSEYKEHAKKYTNFLEEYKEYTGNSNNEDVKNSVSMENNLFQKELDM